MNTFKPRFLVLPGVMKKALWVMLVSAVGLSGGVPGFATDMLAVLRPQQAMAAAPADGTQLLEKHCLNCHVIQKISRYRKNREQWAQTIDNMVKGYGVVLTEDEKGVMLDHLLSLKKAEAKAP